MKKVAIMLLALVLVTGTAFAADGQGAFSLDVSANYASEPESGFDGTFGPEFGVNADLRSLGLDLGPSKSFDLLGRASMSYYNFDGSDPGLDEYRRIPLFLGGRIVFPASPQVKLYGQLGLEFSFDKVDTFAGSETETNFGLVPGVGVIFPVSNQFYLGGNLNVHLITDTYLTLGVTVGFNLP